MADYPVKLQRHGGQYRITLPRHLLAVAGLEDAEFLRLSHKLGGMIIIREYYGKRKEKRDVPEDQA